MRFVTLLFLFAAFQQLQAQPKVSEGKTPGWVKQYDFLDISDTTETNGYAYLLVSRQYQLESREYYYKYVMQITSEKGLSAVASINETFDPSFQTLTFHELKIIRNGKTIDKLDPAKFDVIRREDEMERAVYDKSVNAVYNLPDVRVGDIVEYSFTRKGFNPAFGDHAFGELYLQYGTPVGRFAYRILRDPKRPLVFKTFGESGITAREASLGQLKVTEWIRENVPALLTDDRYPSWFDPFAHVEYSDFQSWTELKQWARQLYKRPQLPNGDLKKVIHTIKSSHKPTEDKIKDCIRISQRDIRYLSFSDGIHGYKPHTPELVYEHRYGDCKDKSFMLALMLGELGIASSPALVSTDDGHELPEMLPNPWAFNHCIVQFHYNDSTYWIDPTLDAQVGPLNSYYFPAYYNALVIDDDASELTPIPFGYKDSAIDIKEEYSMDEVGGYVTLKVRTTYRGDEADDIRSYFHSNTTNEVNKDYLNFYARDFSEISLAKDFEYTDDTTSNVIVGLEEYLVKNFWTIEGKNKTASVYPSFIGTFLKKPDTRVRTMPLAISHPRNISQTIKIRLPEDWDFDDSRAEIESEAFRFERSKFYADRVITMRYHYVTKAAFVPTEAVADHIKKIDEILDENGLTIYKPLRTNTSHAATPYVLLLFVVVAVVVYFAGKRFGY